MPTVSIRVPAEISDQSARDALWGYEHLRHLVESDATPIPQETP